MAPILAQAKMPMPSAMTVSTRSNATVVMDLQGNSAQKLLTLARLVKAMCALSTRVANILATTKFHVHATLDTTALVLGMTAQILTSVRAIHARMAARVSTG